MTVLGFMGRIGYPAILGLKRRDELDEKPALYLEIHQDDNAHETGSK